MTVLEIVKDAIGKHPEANGLCNYDCGCGLDDFAPCPDGPLLDCLLAKSRRLGKDETIGNCGPGDIYYEEIG